jgi:hypothetical protein
MYDIRLELYIIFIRWISLALALTVSELQFNSPPRTRHLLTVTLSVPIDPAGSGVNSLPCFWPSVRVSPPSDLFHTPTHCHHVSYTTIHMEFTNYLSQHAFHIVPHYTLC